MRRSGVLLGAIAALAGVACGDASARAQPNCSSAYDMGKRLGASGTGPGQGMYDNLLKMARNSGCEAAFVAGNDAGFGEHRAGRGPGGINGPAAVSPGPGPVQGGGGTPGPLPSPEFCKGVYVADTSDGMNNAYQRFLDYSRKLGPNDPRTINAAKEYQCARDRVQR